MLSVRINELAHILSLIRALFNYVTVVFEQMIDKELIELFMRAHSVLIDFSCQGFAEN